MDNPLSSLSVIYFTKEKSKNIKILRKKAFFKQNLKKTF